MPERLLKKGETIYHMEPINIMDEERINWLRGMKFDEARGEINISGMRHTLVNSNAFKAYRDAIGKIIGHGADAVLYMAGKQHTETFVNAVIKKSVMVRLTKKFEWGKTKIAEKVVDLLNQHGFGAATIEKMDIYKEAIIRLDNSCIATNYSGKQKGPVCFYIAGLLSGGAKAIVGRDYTCTETHCIAKGDEHCRFVIRPEKN